MAGPQRAILVNGTEFGPNRRRVTIGRGDKCDVRVDHPFVSRVHATITRGKHGWVLCDTSSRNGTFVDRRRITDLVVTADVRVILGGKEEGGVLDLALGPDSEPPHPAAPVAVVAPASAAVASGPAAAPVAVPAFVATHQVPPDGLSTWPSPDPALPEGPRLAPTLGVRVTERRGDWANIVCSNGWAAWVDARRLVPVVER